MVAATHRKLEKAVDVISTQVASCMINKWRAKIKGEEVYNVRNPPGIKEERREKKGRRLLFSPPWKAFVIKH